LAADFSQPSYRVQRIGVPRSPRREFPGTSKVIADGFGKFIESDGVGHSTQFARKHYVRATEAGEERGSNLQMTHKKKTHSNREFCFVSTRREPLRFQ
jgi:hypothetical protein